MAGHFAFTGLGQDHELVAHIAADGSRIGGHGDRLQTEPLEGAQIGDEHAVIGAPGAVVIQIERITILHQEFPSAHDAEARAHFVAELPLNMIQHFRQIPVAAHRIPKNLGDQFFVGGTVQHVPVVAVGDAQHLLAVIIVAPAFAPNFGGLNGRHQQFLGAGAVLFLAHDLFDLF